MWICNKIKTTFSILCVQYRPTKAKDPNSLSEDVRKMTLKMFIYSWTFQSYC